MMRSIRAVENDMEDSEIQRGSFVLLFALEGGKALLAGAVGDSRGGGAIYTAAVVLRAKAGFALTLPS